MIKYKPKISLVGLVSGALLGITVLALLHQNGSIYPTRTQAIAAVVVGAVACGIVLPSLTRLAKVGKVNRRLVARGAR